MSITTTRAKFIRTTMMDIALLEGLKKGADFFDAVYDFISHVDIGDGNIPSEEITAENRIPLEVYTRAVARWQAHRDRVREEYANK